MAKASAKQLAWRKKFASMYGGKKRRSSSKGGSHTAKSNGNGGGKQGVVSWLTSVIALGIGLSDVFARIYDASTNKYGGGSKIAQFGELMIADYTGLKMNLGVDAWGVGSGWKWDWRAMARGYAPIGGAVGFKKATGYLTRIAPVRNLIPRIG